MLSVMVHVEIKFSSAAFWKMRELPFRYTVCQVYAPTSGHDDSEVDHFYQQLQETIDQTPKKDILVVQGDWNAKVGKDAQAD